MAPAATGTRPTTYLALAPAAQHAEYPVEDERGQVFNQAADYVELRGAGDVTFRFQGAAETQLVATQPPTGRRFWLTPRADDANPRLTGQFDLAALAPGTPVTMTVEMWHDIEENYDYGYVLASRDGAEWSISPGQGTRTDNPVGNNLGAGYTGRSLDALGAPGWRQEVFDLSAYAGGPLWVQFSYVTDDGYNAPGWAIDDVAIPALGYAEDFEGPRRRLGDARAGSSPTTCCPRAGSCRCWNSPATASPPCAGFPWTRRASQNSQSPASAPAAPPSSPSAPSRP